MDQLATGMLALGLKPGDRVGIWSPNRAEWVLTQMATAQLGIIMVSSARDRCKHNTNLTSHEWGILYIRCGAS